MPSPGSSRGHGSVRGKVKVKNLNVGMSSKKNRSRFEAVGRGATEVGEREGTEGGPTGAEKEIICSRELLALATPMLIANV